MKNDLHLGLVSVVIFLVASCVKPYEPAVIKSADSFLVVDGVINTTAGARTIINLTRTRKLTDTINNLPEDGARITIETNTGTAFLLTASGRGVYTSDPLHLDASANYRLKISTADGNVYTSSFVPATPSPVIDSVSWKQEADDISIFVTTHNNQRTTRYYRWEYIETWEYNAIYETIYDFKNDQLIFRDTNNYIYKCWSSAPSLNILLHTTAAISEDLVKEFPLLQVKAKHQKLGILYSVMVKQYGLTKPAYEYWQIIQKNTQQLGSLFDAQPSQLYGNIINARNAEEPVIGYITACPVSEKRLFIKRSAIVEGHNPVPGCTVIIVLPSDAPAILRNPRYAAAYGVTPVGIAISPVECVDCRLQGGTTTRPSYWP
jgi:hypothetical protein